MARFEYTLVDDDQKIYMPHLPMKISYCGCSIKICGLVDTGAQISILPYKYGLELGAEWDPLLPVSKVSGPTGRHEARPLKVQATIPGVVDDDGPIELVFFWCKDESDTIILGQADFFLQFDACFYRAAGVFDVQHSQLVPPFEVQRLGVDKTNATH